MSTHTPGPYRVADDLDRMDCIGIYANQTLVCELRDPEDAEDRERMRANAAFIVRACNAHEELVKTLKEIATLLKELPDSERGNSKVHYCAHAALAAIAKAEGGPRP